MQYIHALSLARLDGEHDQIEHGGSDSDFTSSIAWPEGFTHGAVAQKVDKERLDDLDA